MNGQQLGGLIIRYKKGHYLRIWKYGYEWGWPNGGRIRFFPWTDQYKITRGIGYELTKRRGNE